LFTLIKREHLQVYSIGPFSNTINS